jgi:glutamyl-tRNA synthetase
MTVRVRFAPSPTGTLHLGSARSALFNWLHARHYGGTYVLRIEDTDQERSTPENVDQALAMFRWLGLDWDEGPEVGGPYEPYFQSQRDTFYRGALDQMLESGRAYECFCTKQELDADRAAAQAENRPFVYTGRCRSLTADERAARKQAGDAFVIRFHAADQGTTVVDDLVLGATEFENALIGDFVIARADGSPLYNFANVVDDSAMEITHVIRGVDHLSNTPKQILMYEALGKNVPAFAHVPMILGPDGKKKLSKRHHHTATLEVLAEAGYLPEAVRNGLALLGWSRDDVTTVMTTEEIVEAFDVARVRKSPAAIDYDKIKAINGKHIRALDVPSLADEFVAWRDNWMAADAEYRDAAMSVDPQTAVELVQEKIETLADIPPLVAFLSEPFAVEEQAWEKLAKVEQAKLVLDEARGLLEQLEPFDVEAVDGALRGLCERLELKPRVVFGPLRIAITGRTISPGLFESIVAIGRDRAIERLADASSRLVASPV